MRATFEATFTRSFWFVRLGRLEAQLELNPCAAPEGWISVPPSGIAGVMMMNCGRLTLHLENNKASARHFADKRSKPGIVW